MAKNIYTLPACSEHGGGQMSEQTVEQTETATFFRRMREQNQGLTFDDVTLQTGYSEVLPHSVDLATRVTRNIKLNMPLISAAMDTVTEHQMAIGMAMHGGIGVIHKNLTPDEQVGEVQRVKRFLNRKINHPTTVRDDRTVESLLREKEEKGWNFDTFPVVDAEDRLVGIFTKRDLRFVENHSLPISEVMTADIVTAPRTTGINQAYELMRENKVSVLPLVDNEGHLTALYLIGDVMRHREKRSEYTLDKNGQLMVAAAIGAGTQGIDRAVQLIESEVDLLVLESAHADTQSMLETLRALKRDCPSVDVLVGNISNPRSVSRLIDAGADGIKVGQGPGSICTTRVVTGTGAPQLTATYWCAEQSDMPVCTDGGIKYSGHIVKALAAGAETVMLGSLLAGTDASPGDMVTIKGIPHKLYRGMGSLGAMKAGRGAAERYGQESVPPEKRTPEGVEGAVPYKGTLPGVVDVLLGGIRSGMGAIGAASIAELHRRASFLRETAAGGREAHPHDIVIVTEPPNYTR